MGFGTEQQLGNGTGLADIFRGNIGAPQQLGTTQQPNQLFSLLQNLLGDQSGTGQAGFQPGMLPPELTGQPGIQPGIQPGMQPPAFGGKPGLPIVNPQITPQQPGFGGTPLINQQPPQFGGGAAGGAGTGLANPFGNLINQRFVR